MRVMHIAAVPIHAYLKEIMDVARTVAHDSSIDVSIISGIISTVVAASSMWLPFHLIPSASYLR